MDEYNIWKMEILNRIASEKINYAIIGDCITCLDDFGHRIGGIDLAYAWLNDMSFDAIIYVLTNEV